MNATFQFDLETTNMIIPLAEMLHTIIDLRTYLQNAVSIGTLCANANAVFV